MGINMNDEKIIRELYGEKMWKWSIYLWKN